MELDAGGSLAEVRTAVSGLTRLLGAYDGSLWLLDAAEKQARGYTGSLGPAIATARSSTSADWPNVRRSIRERRPAYLTRPETAGGEGLVARASGRVGHADPPSGRGRPLPRPHLRQLQPRGLPAAAGGYRLRQDHGGRPVRPGGGPRQRLRGGAPGTRPGRAGTGARGAVAAEGEPRRGAGRHARLHSGRGDRLRPGGRDSGHEPCRPAAVPLHAGAAGRARCGSGWPSVHDGHRRPAVRRGGMAPGAGRAGGDAAQPGGPE